MAPQSATGCPRYDHGAIVLSPCRSRPRLADIRVPEQAATAAARVHRRYHRHAQGCARGRYTRRGRSCVAHSWHVQRSGGRDDRGERGRPDQIFRTAEGKGWQIASTARQHGCALERRSGTSGIWCGRRDSNPHESRPSAVFKTAASAIPPRPHASECNGPLSRRRWPRRN